ncbi:hypothetical protein BDF19DRAFT_415418 [Syncephalis fuscata]|nr:hypothetical protein BDF19DRAFT_415418 [Syncephalis fuscata]
MDIFCHSVGCFVIQSILKYTTNDYILVFLIHLTALQTSYLLFISLRIYTFLSTLPFDITLLHWSFIGKKLFSKKAMIPIWLVIIIDTTVNIMRIVSLIGFTYWKKNDHILSLFDTFFSELMHTVLSWVTIVTLCALLLWLGFIAYKLRKHPDDHRKFIQLACLTLIAIFTYILFPIYYIKYFDIFYTLTSDEVFKTDFMFNTAYTIRALVFLSIFGIKRPHPPKLTELKIREPLGGMTAVGCDANGKESANTTTANLQCYKCD